ncbi:MAG: hypothetical protein ACD_76C00044G0010 [uncultured bacterium]|nr:MAG: hypothetical protein ACD_76C00044G0010 [uncultured bacterium]HBD05187.1 hypothetical protein [Candidatus Uhrbacteria bacterium]
MIHSRKTALLIISAILLVAPFLPVMTSGENHIVAVSAANTWDYGDYRVEMLNFGARFTDVEGPVRLGEHVVFLRKIEGADHVDVFVMVNGSAIVIPNVSRTAVDPQAYEMNGNRLVWVNSQKDGAVMFDLLEADLETGNVRSLGTDLSLGSIKNSDVRISGNKAYISADFVYSQNQGKPSNTNSGIYRYDLTKHDLTYISNMYFSQRPWFAGVNYKGEVLALVTFMTGEKELWLFSDISDRPIRGTWTPKHEQLYGAHLLSDGRVEYFRMYTREIANPATGETQVFADQQLNWTRLAADQSNLSSVMQIVNGRMAWVDPYDVLWLSKNGSAQKIDTIGSANGSGFVLDNAKLMYSIDPMKNGGFISAIRTFNYDNISLRDKQIITKDMSGNAKPALIGVTPFGDIGYANHSIGKRLTFGYGSNPLIADARHVYWRGSDKNIYEATLSPASGVETRAAYPVRIAGDEMIYLVMGNKRYEIPNDKTYKTWFNSYDNVQIASHDVVVDNIFAGTIGMKPGTRVKLVDDPKVYIVDRDGKLHWLASEQVAYSVYGESWNKGIVDLTNVDMVQFSFGGHILTENDYAKAVVGEL